ncbi:hypothetical protein CALVIDRAFT_528725 [Calocera viscosa TUFC12733]|uniref:Uncharacterized protein n=1 Tax=Calocera viscosa (strain TUFC12733) TaxID=1330018 RepID=A0A167KC51_CALVF|nr:hypothetical protein CALVIDRAFT_528725 [Calocera viscosa TUFC12733]
MSETLPTSSPFSDSSDGAILSSIQSASSELIERYISYLKIPAEIASLPYYTQNRAWISKTTFGLFLRSLTGQPESPIRPLLQAQKRPISPSPGASASPVSEGLEQDSPTLVGKNSKRQRLSKPSKHPDMIEITSRTHVKKIEHRFSLPSLWPVPKEATAFVVDLSGQSAPLNGEGKQIPIDTWMRQEDQDSWKAVSNGRRSGTGIPVAILDGVPCRRVMLRCNGLVACSELDPALLEGYERWDMDMEGRQSVFEAQDAQRVAEPANAQAVIAK